MTIKHDACSEDDELLLRDDDGLQAVYWLCSTAKTKTCGPAWCLQVSRIGVGSSGSSQTRGEASGTSNVFSSAMTTFRLFSSSPLMRVSTHANHAPMSASVSVCTQQIASTRNEQCYELSRPTDQSLCHVTLPVPSLWCPSSDHAATTPTSLLPPA